MGALAHIPREQGNGPALVEAVPVAHAPATRRSALRSAYRKSLASLAALWIGGPGFVSNHASQPDPGIRGPFDE